MTSMGDRIKEAREAVGLSQRELGDLIGAPQSTVSNLEADRTGIGCQRLLELADALGVSTDWLLGREPLRQEFTDAEIIAEFNPTVWATLSEAEKSARIDMIRKMRRSRKRLY